jgi:hypothetical protein
MELIILNDGLYQLIPVTKQMTEHMSLLGSELHGPVRDTKIKVNRVR